MAYQKLQGSEGLKVIKSDDARIPDPSTVVVLDTATQATVGVAAFTANTLTDVGTKFTEAGINVGAIIYNTTAGVAYTVTGVTSDTVLAISPATVGGATDSYTIYNNATIGCVLFVGGAGNVEVQMAARNGNQATAAQPSNQTLTFNNVANGSFLSIQVVRVAAATTATDIIALW